MSQHVRRSVAAVVAFFMASMVALTLGVGGASAYTGDLINDPKVPVSWRQHVPEYDNIKLGPNASLSFGGYGCAQFSLTNLFIKSGARELGFDPPAWNAEAVSRLSLGQPAGVDASGLLNWIGAGSQSGKFTFNHQDAPGGTKGTAPLDLNVVREKAKQYLTVLNVYSVGSGKAWGHWVMVDYIGDDGTIHIIDSGYPVDTLEGDHYNGKTVRAVYFSMNDGTRAEDLPRNSDIGVTPGAPVPDTGDTETVVDIVNGVIAESALEGMPTRVDMTEKMNPVPDLPSDISLSYDENMQLKTLMAASDVETNERGLSGILSLGISFLGVLMAFWGLFMLMAGLFDKSNNFFEGSTLKMLTFGRRHLKEGSEDTSKGATSWWGLAIMVGVAVGIGIFLISGGAFMVGRSVVDIFYQQSAGG